MKAWLPGLTLLYSLHSPTMADPASPFISLQSANVEAIEVCDKMCDKIDQAIGLEHEERHVLKELRKAVDSLRSDSMVYRLLLNTMKNDTYLSDGSPYVRFIQYVMGLHSSSYTHRANNSHYHRKGGMEVMHSLERALKDTQLLLEGNPTGNRHEVTINPSQNKKPRKSVDFALSVIGANSRPGHRQELIGDLKDATYETLVCRQSNKRAFEVLWNLYVVAQQWTARRDSAADDVGNIQDRVEQALDSVLHAFHDRPFAVSPEGDSRVDLSTFAILNYNHEIATRHENLARRTGKAWVDGHVPKYNPQVRDIDALKTSLFGLLWSGTVEQLQQHCAYSSDDPEGPKFERAVEELERALQEAIVRPKKERFVITFCGTADISKSQFLNAFMGRAILPTHGEPHDSRTAYHILSIIAEFVPRTWPCRLRHVEGQTVPELQFKAEPFLVALKKLQAHQYGRMMQDYRHPPEHVFEVLLCDAPSEPSDEEILFRRIHSQWIDLHAVTRNNLLRFEKPGFRLPRMAIGEQNVKALVSFTSCHSSISTEFNF